MIKGKHVELRDIIVVEGLTAYKLHLTIYEGLWIGFESDKNILDFTAFRFDLSQLHLDKSKFAKNSAVEKLVQGLSSAKLELDDLSEIVIGGKPYFQIKDLADGNYIGIDKKGQVFGLLHDPFTIELLHPSVSEFVDAVNAGHFDIDRYPEGTVHQ